MIEVIVVMSIIAMLLTIALPRYFGALDRSKDTVLQENIKVLRITLDKFYSDKGRYPDSLDELVTEKYLRSVPMDPVIESNRSWVLIPPQEQEARGVADVRSGAPGRNKDGIAYGSM